MPDASIRELERAARVAPDDASARLRLVSALARSGRRQDALREIDLRTVPEHAFEDSRRLSEELWREELASLEQVGKVKGAASVIGLDPSGSLIAWCGQSGLRIADLPSGEVIHKETRFQTREILAASGCVFALDEGRQRLTCFSRIRDGMKPVWRPTSPMTKLLSVSPRGDRLLLQDEEVEGVYEWPSLDPVRERPCSANPPIVDWDTGHMLSFELGARTIEVYPLNGGRRSGIELGASGAPLDSLGQGIVAERSPGLTLHGLKQGWKLRLIATRDKLPQPSLSSDGRGVRIVLSGTIVRFDVDAEKGELRSSPGELPRRDPRKDWNGVWHPHADVVLLRKEQNVFELRSLDGRTLRALPIGVVPFKWTACGRGLIVQRGAGDDGSWLELWRAPEGRA